MRSSRNSKRKVSWLLQWNMERRTLYTHWGQKLQVLQEGSPLRETKVLTAMGKVIFGKEFEDASKYVNPREKAKKKGSRKKNSKGKKACPQRCPPVRQKEAARGWGWCQTTGPKSFLEEKTPGISAISQCLEQLQLGKSLSVSSVKRKGKKKIRPLCKEPN